MVVWIRLEEKPWKKRVNSDNVMNVSFVSSSEITPKEMKEVPIKNMPKVTRLRLPKIDIIFPTSGEQKMTATE